MDKLTEGLWRWTARHPEWHPGEFGAEVASYAAQAGDTTLLIDPLLPAGPLVGARCRSTRTSASASPSSSRSRTTCAAPRSSGGATSKDAETTIHGHRCLREAPRRTGPHSSEIDPAVPLPGGVTAHAIGKPRRHETPLHLPSHRALVFGDAVAETGGRLVVWASEKVDAKVERFYRERFNPTLEPLLELDVRHSAGHPRAAADERREARAAQGARRRSPGTTAVEILPAMTPYNRERNRRAQGARRARPSAPATGAR